MCWNIESSVIAAIYGYLVSLYLYKRNYSIRDPWYAMFLSTFTTTQFLDAFFWFLKGEGDDIPCTQLNYTISKYLVPAIIFFQPLVLSWYPSTCLPSLRNPYRLLTVLGMCVPIAYCGCTTLYTTIGGYYDGLQVIMYGGLMPPVWVMGLGILLWSTGVWLFITPWWVGTHILFIGGLNLVLLQVLDGTVQLVSKLCFYCLLLSIMWLLEPLFEPSLRKSQSVVQVEQLDQQQQQKSIAIDEEAFYNYPVKPSSNVVITLIPPPATVMTAQ